jgi:hypothetical protein
MKRLSLIGFALSAFACLYPLTSAQSAEKPPLPEPVKADKANILIIGSQSFIDQANAAINILATCAPDALKTADDYIDQIVQSERSGMNVESGDFFASDTTAFAPGYDMATQAFWFAGTIVHDAHHRWQSENGVNTDWGTLTLIQRKTIEADARDVQLKVLKGCVKSLPKGVRSQTGYMIQYLQSMQDQAVDCEYCDVDWENRDW